jgi:hypothetical protein
MIAYTTTGSPRKPFEDFEITGTNGSFYSDSFPPQKQESTILCKNYTTLFWTSCHR